MKFNCGSQNYRMSGVGRDAQESSSLTPGSEPTKNQTIWLTALSKCFLSPNRFVIITTSFGSPFQCPNTISVKKLFLTPSLNHPWHSSMLFPQVLLLSPEITDQHLSLSSHSPVCTYSQGWSFSGSFSPKIIKKKKRVPSYCWQLVWLYGGKNNSIWASI